VLYQTVTLWMTLSDHKQSKSYLQILCRPFPSFIIVSSFIADFGKVCQTLEDFLVFLPN